MKIASLIALAAVLTSAPAALAQSGNMKDMDMKGMDMKGMDQKSMSKSGKEQAVQTGVSEHHQRQYELMKDMSQEMNKMTERMSRGDLTPEQRKQMGQHMKRMSKMMDRMAGLSGRPAMKEPEMKKQMEQMRKDMDDMMREPSMKSSAK